MTSSVLTTAAAPPAPTLPQRFAEQVRRTPDAVAVVAGATSLTYRELDERSEQLARRIRGRGVRDGQPVAVLMQRSPELAVALLAVTRAGAAFLPLHDTYPVARAEWILADAACPLLLADRVHRARGLPAGADVLVVDDPDDPDDPAPRGPLPSVVDPDCTAYVMYTSGSTGRPKGVVVPHRAALGLMLDPTWESGRHERVLMVAPYAFGVSNYELWVPLLHGGTVVMAPPRELDVETLRSLVREHAITAVHLTAGLFRVIADEAPDAVAGVREVMTGGDVVTAAAVARVRAACPDLVVRVMYGSTESVLFTTHMEVTGHVDPGSAVPIGRPMAGITVHLLDEELRPVPDGVEGEIHVAGSRLAAGYLGRPDLTAERFVADPFGPPGGRMYRTGDLGRRNADGLLEFIGRADDQVKVRGFRVEPREVEAGLTSFPGVADVAVVPQQTEHGTKRLVGYVVPQGAPLDLHRLRAHAAERLADFMVPEVLVPIDALPLTANGKLDRRALPVPEHAETDTGTTSYRAPRTPTEQLVCDLFADVLGVDLVGLDDDFFALGGQSLLGMRLINRIRDARGAVLPVVVLFDSPTPAGLAAELDAAT